MKILKLSETPCVLIINVLIPNKLLLLSCEIYFNFIFIHNIMNIIIFVKSKNYKCRSFIFARIEPHICKID